MQGLWPRIVKALHGAVFGEDAHVRNLPKMGVSIATFCYTSAEVRMMINSFDNIQNLLPRPGDGAILNVIDDAQWYKLFGDATASDFAATKNVDQTHPNRKGIWVSNNSDTFKVYFAFVKVSDFEAQESNVVPLDLDNTLAATIKSGTLPADGILDIDLGDPFWVFVTCEPSGTANVIAYQTG